MTEPARLPKGRLAPLSGAQSKTRNAERERIMMEVQLPRCPAAITLIEAASCMSMIIDNGALKQIAIAIYEPGRASALMHLFSPEDARTFADSLVQVSFQMDAEAKAEADRKLADIDFASKPGADRPGFNPQVPKGGAA